jgi:hypothetical protein
MGARKTCSRSTSSFTGKYCRLLPVPRKKRKPEASGSAIDSLEMGFPETQKQLMQGEYSK